MASPMDRISTSLAMKRARSQESRRSEKASPSPAPVSKAAKTASQDEEVGVPAFLRQSKAGTPFWGTCAHAVREPACTNGRAPYADIISNFHDLEWQQQLRIAQGRADPSSPWFQDTAPQVRLRNRYVNVQPWERSRIRLQVAEGRSDYINASPISLQYPAAASETTYIVTQGPKQTGMSHFWQMIWHETAHVAVIVMLTQTAEAGREKCFQYFPLDEEPGVFRIEATDDGEDLHEGKVQLVETVYHEAARSTVRELVMTVGEKKKKVWHLLFSGWPDFDVPEGEDRVALLELLALSASKNEVASTPRIIHCSAGVGRSGTFIALDFLLAQLRTGAVAKAKEGEDMIYDLVNRLREQRMTMVQSDVQYHFLYEVLHEQFKQWQVSQASGEAAPAEALHQLAQGVKSAFLQVKGHSMGRTTSDSSEKT